MRNTVARLGQELAKQLSRSRFPPIFGGPASPPFPVPGGDLWGGDDLSTPSPDLPADPSLDNGRIKNGQQTEDDAQAGTKDNICTANCPNCAPRVLGREMANYYGNVRTQSRVGYAYQHFVCPWHVHIPESDTIMEWWYGVDFDGMDPGECLLYETKYGYAEFLTQEDYSPAGRPKLDPRKPWAQKIFRQIADRAKVKMSVLLAHEDVRLRYVFSESITYVFVATLLGRAQLTRIETEHRPWSVSDGS